MRQINKNNNTVNTNTKEIKQKILDEKQQIDLIGQFRSQAASFDTMMKWIFLGVSVVLSAAAIFVVARIDEVNIQKSLSVGGGGGSGDQTEGPLRHWIVVFVGLISITYGSLQVKNFKPEKDWEKWIGMNKTSLSKKFDDVSIRNDKHEDDGNNNDDDADQDNDDTEIEQFLNCAQNKFSRQNFSFLQKYGCIMVSATLLFIQLLFLAANKDIYPPEEKWTLHYLFYHCSSSFLAVAHAICWPILLEQMSQAQKDLKYLETKKYQISQA